MKIDAETRKKQVAFLQAIGEHYRTCQSSVTTDAEGNIQLLIGSAEKTEEDPLSAYPGYRITANCAENEAAGIPPVIALRLTVWPLDDAQDPDDCDLAYEDPEEYNNNRGPYGILAGEVCDNEVTFSSSLLCTCKTEQEFAGLFPLVIAAIDTMKAEMASYLEGALSAGKD